MCSVLSGLYFLREHLCVPHVASTAQHPPPNARALNLPANLRRRPSAVVTSRRG